MNFLYTIDNRFFVQMMVSIGSLIDVTNKQISIFVICDEITDINKRKLNELNSDLVNIILLPSPNLPEKLIADRGSISQFYRIMIGKIFRKINIEKLIYLDADTIINSDIGKLFNTDLGPFIIGGALDPWSIKYRKLLKIDRDSGMLNSGVLLINVRKWKNEKLDNKIKKLIGKRKSFIQGDQGILDEIFNGKFLVINPCFNAISSYFELNINDLKIFRKPHIFYNDELIKSAYNTPVVVHFTGTFMNNRPWYAGSSHPYKNKWLKQYKKIFKEEFEPVVHAKSISFYLYKLLPNKLAISILGFLQNNVRPIWLTLKD